MENGFLTSGLACWNRQVKRAERASRPPVRLSVFTVDDQPQAPETHTFRGLHLCLEPLVPNETRPLADSESGEDPAGRHCSTFLDRWLTDWFLGRWLRSPPRRPPLWVLFRIG